MNITINKRLTGEGRGGIIRTMKSRKNSARVGTVIARQISCQIGRANFGNIHTEIAGQTPLLSCYHYVIGWVIQQN